MASVDEIKRKYRKLAHEFHPDKNPGDKYAESRFHDIKEAYETLSNPYKKEAWLQERWLRQVHNESMGESRPLTPYLILDKVLKLDKYVSTQDVFRMDQQTISEMILDIVSEENVNCLLSFRDKEINKTIIQYLLSSARPIRSNKIASLWPKLEQIAAKDHVILNEINRFRLAKKSREQNEKWTLPVVMIITVVICVLIYLSGR